MATAKPTEQQKAALSKKRGETAAALEKQGHFQTPEEKQKFISAEGDAEAKGSLTQDKMTQLSQQGTMSFKEGGVVPKTGLALVHKGETVIPAKEGRSSEYRKVYLNRKNKTMPAKQQTRQDGGHSPVKGESHDSGSKKVPYKQAQE